MNLELYKPSTTTTNPAEAIESDIGGRSVNALVVYVANPGSGGSGGTTALPTNPLAGQGSIATTGTAVQLPANALQNGVVIKASPDNTAPMYVGRVGVTNTNNGTGNGYRLEPGEAISFAVSNTSAIYINGSASDVFYFAGN